jgi:hypothetical protein
VVSRLPESWQKETLISNLQDDIDRVNPIAPA